MENRFNIRVYALIVHDGHILITDEHRGGMHMSKFPGGGLEWGEGVLDCLKRELLEELSQEPLTIEHFYTTDFFVTSAFRKEDQMISIYYKVTLPSPGSIKVVTEKFAFSENGEGAQTFRWVRTSNFSQDDVTLPIDKRVAEMLK